MAYTAQPEAHWGLILAPNSIANPQLMAKLLLQQGMKNVPGDTRLAYLTPQEEAFLKARGGSGRADPTTGILHFDDGGDGGDSGDSGDSSDGGTGDSGNDGWSGGSDGGPAGGSDTGGGGGSDTSFDDPSEAVDNEDTSAGHNNTGGSPTTQADVDAAALSNAINQQENLNDPGNTAGRSSTNAAAIDSFMSDPSSWNANNDNAMGGPTNGLDGPGPSGHSGLDYGVSNWGSVVAHGLLGALPGVLTGNVVSALTGAAKGGYGAAHQGWTSTNPNADMTQTDPNAIDNGGLLGEVAGGGLTNPDSGSNGGDEWPGPSPLSGGGGGGGGAAPVTVKTNGPNGTTYSWRPAADLTALAALLRTKAPTQTPSTPQTYAPNNFKTFAVEAQRKYPYGY